MGLQQLKPALESSKGRVGPWGGARLVNAFAEQSDGDKAEMYAVQAISGLKSWTNIATQSVRGAHWMAGVMYAVIGTNFYSISSTGTATVLGTVGGINPVRIDDNGTQIAIHDGNQTGYVWNGTTLATPLNLPAVSDVAFIDDYFVWTVYGGDQFIISALGDGTSYDPLDIATVEGSPDALVGVVNSHRALMFFGTDTTEIWYDSGDPLFPFARDGNAFLERGCADRNSTVKLDNTTFWVGNDRIIYRLDGYTPVRVSSYAVERTLDDAQWFRGFTYSEEGHKFYVLNTDLGTWAYDIAGMWHERQSFGLNYYRIGCAVEAYGTVYLGSNQTGTFYTYDLDYNDEDGNPMPVTIQLPPVGDGVSRQNFYSLEVFMQTGVGDLVTTDPQAILTYSKDGGQNWSNEMWRSIGAQGQTKTRAVWRNLGEFRQIQLKLCFPDKVKRLVLAYQADIR